MRTYKLLVEKVIGRAHPKKLPSSKKGPQPASKSPAVARCCHSRGSSLALSLNYRVNGVNYFPRKLLDPHGTSTEKSHHAKYAARLG
jgi:hypothetical protein